MKLLKFEIHFLPTSRIPSCDRNERTAKWEHIEQTSYIDRSRGDFRIVSMVINVPEEGLDYTQFTEYLYDVGKVLADTFHQILMTGRPYITSISKSVKSTVEATKPKENWFYEQKFADQVEEAKVIEKASSKIRAVDKTKQQYRGQLQGN